jgi:metal-dependent amidase/aminoacylase/carboxypeptidase family protein
MRFCLLALLCSMVAGSTPAQQAKLDDMVDQQLPSLVAIYKGIHASPELSHREEKTSALLAGELRSWASR